MPFAELPNTKNIESNAENLEKGWVDNLHMFSRRSDLKALSSLQYLLLCPV